MFSVNAVIILH